MKGGSYPARATGDTLRRNPSWTDGDPSSLSAAGLAFGAASSGGDSGDGRGADIGLEGEPASLLELRAENTT